ncbi:MAG: hypothetical protein KatS3mg052_1771 [Candidatus Roseilinea sp.]|nr:MAG: hypothetical protein KatS3mg052_1771 [Candidatus Roseilinea sp.]
MPDSPDPRIRKLRELRAQTLVAGGEDKIKAHRAKGKLTARERLDLLLDPGSFTELDPFVTHRCTEFGLANQRYLGDSVVTGYGQIDGRLVFVFSQDFTVFGGSLSEAHAEKICKIMDLAMKVGAPVIGLNDSGRGAHPGRADSRAWPATANIFLRNVTLASAAWCRTDLARSSGRAPAARCIRRRITDFILHGQAHSSHMFLTGPDVVRTRSRTRR